MAYRGDDPAPLLPASLEDGLKRWLWKVLGFLLLGERVAPRTWLTMSVALAGAVVMVSDSHARGAITGDLLAIVMAGLFATATVLVRRHPDIQMAPAAALASSSRSLAWLPLKRSTDSTRK